MPQPPSKTAPPKATPKGGKRVLGAKAFAAISSVEGLRLSKASRQRLTTSKAAGLSGDERRAEVLRAYTATKPK